MATPTVLCPLLSPPSIVRDRPIVTTPAQVTLNSQSIVKFSKMFLLYPLQTWKQKRKKSNCILKSLKIFGVRDLKWEMQCSACILAELQFFCLETSHKEIYSFMGLYKAWINKLMMLWHFKSSWNVTKVTSHITILNICPGNISDLDTFLMYFIFEMLSSKFFSFHL